MNALPLPLATLRRAGYDPQTDEEAVRDAAAYLTADEATAAAWILGARDLVRID